MMFKHELDMFLMCQRSKGRQLQKSLNNRFGLPDFLYETKKKTVVNVLLMFGVTSVFCLFVFCLFVSFLTIFTG